MEENNMEEPRPRLSNTQQLLAMVERLMDTRQIELWHDQDSRAFATVKTGTHEENLPVMSSVFEFRLREIFYAYRHGIVPEKSLKEVVDFLAGLAILEGEKFSSPYRVHRDGESVYIDLGDADWQYVEVNSSKWTLRTGKGPKFWRSEDTKALPVPVSGGDPKLLSRYLNINSDEQFTLILAWIIQTLIPDEPYPILPLSGEQGSAKSTVARILVSLTDPKKAPLRSLPKSEKDLLIQARSSQVLAFDNISYIKPDMSDALCRLSTGAGLSTRALYTNDVQMIFEARRPVILTGITDIVTRGDLLDRSVPVDLKAIPENKRRLESDLVAQFENDKPYIFGCLLDLLSDTLRLRNDISLNAYPRMADFARTGEAVSRVLGRKHNSFVQSIKSIKSASSELIVESSSVGVLIRSLMGEGNDWVGRASDLLSWLNNKCDADVMKRKDWPKDATRLSSALKRLAPSLRAEGIEINFDMPSRRLITITSVQDSSVNSDTASSQLALDVADDAHDTDFEHI